MVTNKYAERFKRGPLVRCLGPVTGSLAASVTGAGVGWRRGVCEGGRKDGWEWSRERIGGGNEEGYRVLGSVG